MSEFITIQVGQCGNQIGSAFWQQVLNEYGVQKSADRNHDVQDNFQTNKAFNSFFYSANNRGSEQIRTFYDLERNKIKARAVLIDMESSVISRFKNWHLNYLFDDKCFVSNYPGSGNNWAQGYCDHGRHYKNKILNTIQRAVEACHSLHGFILLFSVGGGTGSGLGTFVLSLLKEYYPSIERFVICVYPTGTEDVITCPYNMALSTKELIDNASVVFPVENRSLLEIVQRQLKKHNSIGTPDNFMQFKPFQDLNTVIVNMILNLTSGCRFPGSLNLDMNDINTNMVPYPKLQFISSGFAPITANTRAIHNRKATNKQIKDEVLLSALGRSNTLLKINPIGQSSILLSSSLIARGDYTLSDMRGYVDRLQKRGRFTAWSSKAVRIGLCGTASPGHPVSMLALFNTTAMSELFKTVDQQFMKLYTKKAHIHHYQQISGFDESYFAESHHAIQDCINSYREIEVFTLPKIPRLRPTNI